MKSYIYPVLIDSRKGNFTSKIEVNLSRGVYTLDTEFVNYSFGSLHQIFRKSFKQFSIFEKNIETVLILGFGAGSVAELINKNKPSATITGVELDPVIISVAKEYFHLNEYPRLQVFCEDAFRFVENHSLKYDLIVVDVFIEGEVPLNFYKEYFLANVKGLLNEDGVLIFNTITQRLSQKEKVANLKSKMTRVFGKVLHHVLKQNNVENTILMVELSAPQID